MPSVIISEFTILMAAMVARGSTPLASSSTSPETMSRNKRKFRAEPLHMPEPESGSYDECPDCEACRERVEQPDWSDLTETQLEETLLINLDTIFRTAIRTVMSYGYAEEAAVRAVVQSTGPVTNATENALTVLRSGKDLELSSIKDCDAELKKHEKNVLHDMVSMIVDLRKSFSRGDAMWCLLISDMNMGHACSPDFDALSMAPAEPKPALPNLPSGKFSASDNAPDSTNSSEQEKKTYVGKKGHMSNSKRESILRQKNVHLEKSYRMFGSKAAIRAGKHGLGGLLLEKRSIVAKNTTMKITKSVANNTPQVEPKLNLSLATVPTANTELSLSISAPPKSDCIDKKNEMVEKLFPRIRELQVQLQQWSDWGQQKVMQAARRLSKDKPELQALRQEKDDTATLKKEKQNLEDNTRKKFAEMEIALSRASSQVETTGAIARSHQVENYELRKELEAAQRRAAESAASCEEVSNRESKTQKQFQTWEKQKGLFHEELASEKRRLVQLQQQLEQAKEHCKQHEARWKQEAKAKDEVLIQVSTARKELEQAEISGRAKENAMMLKAETDLQRHKEDVKKLEHQIAQLRLLKDSPKIAALKWGTETEAQNFSKFFDPQEESEVPRERECTICLFEERSVVFFPCLHQTLCTECNEEHEKQGMKDCPSCRTPIQRRICVRYA